MADDIIRTSIAKLKGQKDFRVWRIQIESVLEATGLLEYLTECKPIWTNDESESEYTEHDKEWFKENAQARSILINCCVREIVINLEHQDGEGNV